MVILIALGIAMAAVAYVAAPFFFGVGQTARVASDGGQASMDLEDVLSEKETVYAAIQELDFDWKSGKLSAEDYQSSRHRQEERAAALLQQIDAMQGTAKKTELPPKTRREKRRG